jgi:hypothetical protein
MSLSEPLLEEAGSRSQYLHPRGLVLLAERHEPRDGEGPGVARAAVFDHAEALDERGSHLDAGAFASALDEAVVDADEWADETSVYRVGDDRLSAYPQAWHDALGESRDLVEMVRYLTDTDFEGVEAWADETVPEDDLLDIAAAVGGFDREAAKAELERLRDEGRLVEDADQHPDAGVYPPEADQESDVKSG